MAKIYVVLKHEWCEVGDGDSEKQTEVYLVTFDKDKAERTTKGLDSHHATFGEVVEMEIT
jgi:hypothetical protein